MDSYFLLFKPGPLAHCYLELFGFENREQVRIYAKAHFPKDWAEVFAPDEFAPQFHSRMFALAAVEYTPGVIIECL